MKIHILGGSGSGKTYLADKLSRQHGIPHYDLDDIQWNNEAVKYGIKNTKEKRAELLEGILVKDNWIIEGVYYEWCKKCFKDADKIYVLETPLGLCKRRVVKRFIRRKLGIEKGKKENLKSVKNLLQWMESYQYKDMVKVNRILVPYSYKVERI